MRAYWRDWTAANPDKARAKWRNKRAKRLAAGGRGVSELEWAALIEAANGRCFYCGERPKVLEMDHVIPLAPSNGDPSGQHAFKNVLPACGACNQSKSNHSLDDWYGPSARLHRRRRRRLMLRAQRLLDSWAAA